MRQVEIARGERAPSPELGESSDLVCHCRRVTYGVVASAIESGAHSLAAVQRETTACTRCFGCRFELQRMLKVYLGEAYTPTPFVTPLPDRQSTARRLLARFRGRANILPRRMYMPVLAGYRGADVHTRVVVFNWQEEGAGDAPPVSMRADLLELDGTRRQVFRRAIAPRCSTILDLQEVAPEGLANGVGVLKLVVDAGQLGSLRPYFQLVSPGGITSTHEKAGPRNPASLEKRRPYYWLFPVGHSPRPEEAYLFCTNTQAKPMVGHELLWRSEDDEEARVPFPPLELDQSAILPLHEHFPQILGGDQPGSVRLSPTTHKVAGFILRRDPATERWRVQHL